MAKANAGVTRSDLYTTLLAQIRHHRREYIDDETRKHDKLDQTGKSEAYICAFALALIQYQKLQRQSTSTFADTVTARAVRSGRPNINLS